MCASPSTRLFIGNLADNIPDASLCNLLNRFGSLTNFERSLCRSFAHVTIGSEAVLKCINALNRTKWCGTLLRVERAKEHFMERLKAEWEEQKAKVAAKEGMVVESADVAVAFVGMQGGKHERFDIDDLSDVEVVMVSGGLAEDSSEGSSDSVVVDDVVDKEESIVKDSTMDASREVEQQAQRVSKEQVAKSSIINSTTQLFGISSGVKRASTANQGIAKRARQEKSNLKSVEHVTVTNNDASTMDASTMGASTVDASTVDASTVDASTMNVETEKERELSVLRSVLAGESKLRSGEEREIGKRRLGLFRKLIKTNVDDAAVCNVNVGARTEVVRRSTQLSTKEPQLVRRAGLYRKILRQ